jgi:hypothetical protein
MANTRLELASGIGKARVNVCGIVADLLTRFRAYSQTPKS